jgi:general secretion pathway protein I
MARSAPVADRRGFTLLEMLVALAVFSLAALALLRLEGATVRQTGELDERMLAQLVARNLAVETVTDPAPPAIGQSAGETVNGGRRWRWARLTSRTPDQRLVRVDISVATSGAPTLLTIVRPAT